MHIDTSCDDVKSRACEIHPVMVLNPVHVHVHVHICVRVHEQVNGPNDVHEWHVSINPVTSLKTRIKRYPFCHIT